jgi:hypothetical protein
MTTATAAPTERPNSLDVYRDDGPLARAIGRVVRVPLPPFALIAAGVAPLIVVIAITGDGASNGVAAATLAWFVVLGGLASAGTDTSPLRWLGPPALRLGEYAGLLWLGALGGDTSHAASFALLAAVAWRHYDLVYRLRHRAVTPPAWVNALSGGWDGRLVAGWVLLALDALPGGFYALAVIFGVVFVAESAAGWVHWARTARQTLVYEDEEDEGQ